MTKTAISRRRHDSNLTRLTAGVSRPSLGAICTRRVEESWPPQAGGAEIDGMGIG